MAEKIIALKKSIIPACDFASLEKFRKLVAQTTRVKGIGAFKIGFSLALAHGLPKTVKTARTLTRLPLIYDHQKAGTDIPDAGEKFARACADAGVDAVIIFPQAGPETERAWIRAARGAGLGVIVGGEMTHAAFLARDKGFIADNAPKRILEIAAREGVRDFVVPGNKPARVKEYRVFLEKLGVKPILYSPGFVAQGGRLNEAARVAGCEWHAIVGRALYEARDFKKAAQQLVSQLGVELE